MSGTSELITAFHMGPQEACGELIAAVERKFGALTIDLAATARDTKAPNFITPDENSLSSKVDWGMRIGSGIGWLNPPPGDLAPWSAKAAYTARYHGSRILMIAQAAIDAPWWWRDVWNVPSASIHVLTPRVSYDGLPLPVVVVAYNFDYFASFAPWEWQA
jgi:hypothetical protein